MNPATCHLSPVSPALMAEDLDSLAGLFAETADATPEMIRVFAVHHTLAQLVALGWLVKAPGRWSNTYAPAGGLAERLGWQPPTPNAEPGTRNDQAA